MPMRQKTYEIASLNHNPNEKNQRTFKPILSMLCIDAPIGLLLPGRSRILCRLRGT